MLEGCPRYLYIYYLNFKECLVVIYLQIYIYTYFFLWKASFFINCELWWLTEIIVFKHLYVSIIVYLWCAVCLYAYILNIYVNITKVYSF